MIQPNILKELTDCIHKYSSYVTANMTKIDITLFLLGDKFKIKNKKSDKKGIVYLSPDSIRNLYAGKCSLSQEALGLLICPKSRSLKRLFYLGLTLNDRHMRQLTQEIQQIYTKYFPDSSNNLDFNTMVSSLVYQHFLGTDMVEDLFFPFDRKRKLETCSSYIPWIEKEEELYQLIKNIDSESSCSNQHGNSGDNLVFLTGQPGSGKTQLVKHCLQTKDKRKDIFWLTTLIDLPLSQRIQDIKFLCEKSNPEDILNTLEYKISASLLIIDLPIIGDNDYEFIDKHFKNMELNILIVTNTLEIPDCYTSINIDNRPVENLKEIYKSDNPDLPFTGEEFIRLCAIVSYNPFIIRLLAKAQAKEQIKIDKLLDSSSWHIDGKNLPKIHTSYLDKGTKSGSQITNLVERILTRYDENFLKKAGSELSIFAKNEIPISVLAKDVSDSDINEAINLGLLQYMDSAKSIVQMPPVIADIIWQKYPIKYADYKERIHRYLDEIALGQARLLSYNSLYGHVLTLIYRFHFQITEMKSRINKASKDSFIEWNHLLCEFILHFIKLGNANAAENILSRLYVYESKTEIKCDLVPELQLWERKIFKLHIDFANNNSPINTLEKAISSLKELQETCDEENAQENIPIYLIILSKVYAFITDIIDTLLLKQIIMNAGKRSKNPQEYYFNTTKLLEMFLNIYPFKNDTFYYYRIIYHYLITNYYYTKDTINQDILLEKIQDNSLKFKAKIWILYYKTLKEFKSSQSGFLTSNPSSKRLDTITREFRELFAEFHNKVTSFNTSILFCYCTIMLDLLLPSNYFYTRKIIRLGLKEAYKSITTQLLLTEEEKNRLIFLLKITERYSKFKQYYSDITDNKH